MKKLQTNLKEILAAEVTPMKKNGSYKGKIYWSELGGAFDLVQ